jgi:hypothetical protein
MVVLVRGRRAFSIRLSVIWHVSESMPTYCLHHLSVQEQHFTLAQAQTSVLCMLSRLERLRPLLQRKRARVIYDHRVEIGSLERSARNFLGLVNTLSSDLRVRWFIAVKNHTHKPEADRISVAINDFPEWLAHICGTVPEEFVAHQHTWLSFGGTQVFDSLRIEISTQSTALTILANCSNEQSLVNEWPIYEPSSKHRLDEYLRNGVIVSAMDLSVTDAQAALLVAEEFEGSRYVAVRGKIYRFIPTSAASIPPIFHGFRLDDRLVPEGVRRIIEST